MATIKKIPSSIVDVDDGVNEDMKREGYCIILLLLDSRTQLLFFFHILHSSSFYLDLPVV